MSEREEVSAECACWTCEHVERELANLRQRCVDAEREGALFREAKARGYEFVPVSTEMLAYDKWTDRPLRVLLTKNDDGTASITFRDDDDVRRLTDEADALRAVAEAAREFVADYGTDANHAVWLMSNLETAVRALDAARGGER